MFEPTNQHIGPSIQELARRQLLLPQYSPPPLSKPLLFTEDPSSVTIIVFILYTWLLSYLKNSNQRDLWWKTRWRPALKVSYKSELSPPRLNFRVTHPVSLTLPPFPYEILPEISLSASYISHEYVNILNYSKCHLQAPRRLWFSSFRLATCLTPSVPGTSASPRNNPSSPLVVQVETRLRISYQKSIMRTLILPL